MQKSRLIVIMKNENKLQFLAILLPTLDQFLLDGAVLGPALMLAPLLVARHFDNLVDSNLRKCFDYYIKLLVLLTFSRSMPVVVTSSRNISGVSSDIQYRSRITLAESTKHHPTQPSGY